MNADMEVVQPEEDQERGIIQGVVGSDVRVTSVRQLPI
jgi:hypothetical protein